MGLYWMELHQLIMATMWITLLGVGKVEEMQ
jgi:hypothetical protein